MPTGSAGLGSWSPFPGPQSSCEGPAGWGHESLDLQGPEAAGVQRARGLTVQEGQVPAAHQAAQAQATLCSSLAGKGRKGDSGARVNSHANTVLNIPFLFSGSTRNVK